jgi:VanZ family protein
VPARGESREANAKAINDTGAVMPEAPTSRLALYLALGYTLLILYASLSPFTGWRDPGTEPFQYLLEPIPRYTMRFDLIVNVLAYIPFGMLVTLVAYMRYRLLGAVSIAIALGLALSVSLETVQGYLPGRISSNVDIATNVFGALSGALLAARAGTLPFITQRVADWRERWFLPEGIHDLGIALIALWFFSQLDPSLPLLGIVFFSDGIQAQLAGVAASGPSRLLGPLSVTMNLVSVGLLLMLVMRAARFALAAVALLVAIATLIKLVAATALLRSEATFLWVSQEVALAIAVGATLAAAAALMPRARILAACAAVLAVVVVLSIFKPGETHTFLSLRLFRFNYAQLLHYTGLAAAVAEAWPFAGLAYLTLLWRKDRKAVGLGTTATIGTRRA